MTTKTLRIYDMDGTLIDRATGGFLPGVLDALKKEFLPLEEYEAILRARSWDHLFPEDAEEVIQEELADHRAYTGNTYFAIATNQGGVGLRHWMEQGGFGDPESLPTQAEIEQRIEGARLLIEQVTGRPCKSYVCYRYQSKSSGKWSPIPPGRENEPQWSVEWRKPDSGMLLQAMRDAGIDTDAWMSELAGDRLQYRLSSGKWRVRMIGDSAEDEAAAVAAHIDFTHAHEHFPLLGNPQLTEINAARNSWRKSAELTAEHNRWKHIDRQIIDMDAPTEAKLEALAEIDAGNGRDEYAEQQRWMQSQVVLDKDNLYVVVPSLYANNRDYDKIKAAFAANEKRNRAFIGRIKTHLHGRTWAQAAVTDFDGLLSQPPHVHYSPTNEQWRFDSVEGFTVIASLYVGDPRRRHAWQIMKW